MGDYLISPKFVEIFDTYFPYYLSYGMSYDEFWNGRPELVKAYKKAYEMKLNQKNWELWMQGMYIHAGVDVSLAKLMGNKQAKYLEEPLPITEKQLEEKREEEARKKFEKIKAIMKAKAKKRGEVNDNNDR